MKKWFLCFTVFLLVACFHKKKEFRAAELEKPAVEEIAKARKLATTYLQNQISFNGRFRYWQHIDPRVQLKPKYNLVRHVGAIYSLQQQGKEVEVEGLKRSLRYLWKSSLAPAFAGTLAFWSTPKLTHEKETVAKLGASGLGLLVFANHLKKFPDEFSIDTLRQVGNFLLQMQNEQGAFSSKYLEEGIDKSWVSLYYPGEAILGLLSFYELTGEKKWLEGAVKGLLYLAKKRQDLKPQEIPADHWSLIAMGKLATLDHGIDENSLALLKNHGILLVEKMFSEQILEAETPILLGGFRGWGEVTPTATRLEGLMAVASFLNVKEEASFRQRIDWGMRFLVDSQIKSPKFLGAFPRAKSTVAEESKKAEKFNKRVGELRIDYTQHALSALTLYQDF